MDERLCLVMLKAVSATPTEVVSRAYLFAHKEFSGVTYEKKVCEMLGFRLINNEPG
jgi:hypothetical protein